MMSMMMLMHVCLLTSKAGEGKPGGSKASLLNQDTLNAPAHCPRAELASTSIFINFKCTHTQGRELFTVEVGLAALSLHMSFYALQAAAE